MKEQINNGLPYIPMFAPAFVPRFTANRVETDLICLHDADYMKYIVTSRIFSKLQQNYNRDEISLEDEVESMLNGLHNDFQCKGIIHCFSGSSSNTFRAHVAVDKKYKGNRDKTVDKQDYPGKIDDMYKVVEYMAKTNTVIMFKDLEADDVLSMLQCEHTFIYSKDKDLLQIPGIHFDMKLNKLYEISEEAGFRNLCYQMLIGDTTDNISGCPGIGPKKASAIINETENIKDLPFAILKTYHEKFNSITVGTDCFVETWNLVKMRMSRGAYNKEKYSQAYATLDLFINKK